MDGRDLFVDWLESIHSSIGPKKISMLNKIVISV